MLTVSFLNEFLLTSGPRFPLEANPLATSCVRSENSSKGVCVWREKNHQKETPSFTTPAWSD